MIKGAPEILLSKCRGYYTSDGDVMPFSSKEIKNKLAELMKKGMRCIAVCVPEATAQTVLGIAENIAFEGKNDESLFKEMNLLYIVGVRDEIRREAARSVNALKNAGIQTVMITGDSYETACAVAKECRILTGDRNERVFLGSELEKMTDEQIGDELKNIRVVARVLPGDKSRLIRIAKSLGYVTAMTGDGLNDAPALKAADVGFAMGNGTEVAKEAGDIIIVDSNIASIERAVLYGRTILKSIRKFLVFQLTMNFCAVGISIVGPFIGIENPVTVIQMLWINMIIDTFAAIAFAGEPPKKRYMDESPVPRGESVLNGNMITKVFVMGVYTMMICLYFLTSDKIRDRYFSGAISPEFLSAFFALFVFCGVMGAINSRTERLNVFAGILSNKVFICIICIVLTAQIVMVYFGGAMFRTVPLTYSQMRLLLCLSLTVIPVGRVLELLMKRRVKH